MTHRHTKQCGCAPPGLLAAWATRTEAQRAIGRTRRPRAKGVPLTPAQLERNRKASEAARAAELARGGPTEAQQRVREAGWRAYNATKPRKLVKAHLAKARAAQAIIRRERGGPTPAQLAQVRSVWPKAVAAAAEATRGKPKAPEHAAKLRRKLHLARLILVAQLGDHDDAVCPSCGLIVYHSTIRPTPGVRRHRPTMHYTDDPCPGCGGPITEQDLVPHEPGPKYLTTGCAKPRKARATA